MAGASLNQFLDELLVVVRHCGERTAPALIDDLLGVVGADSLLVIEEFPFRKAAIETYRQAARRKQRYLLVLDGDVTLYHDTFEILHRSVRSYPPEAIRMVHVVDDKFRSGPSCQSGNHFLLNHRSRLIHEFLSSPYAQDDPRFESMNISALAGRIGLARKWTVQTPLLRHAHEQYYRHVYVGQRNAWLKHRNQRREIEEHIRHLVELHPEDFDYRVALAAIRDVDCAQINTAANTYPDISEVLDSLGIEEKTRLATGANHRMPTTTASARI